MSRRRQGLADGVKWDPSTPSGVPDGCKAIQVGGHTKRSAGKEQWALVSEQDHETLSKHNWSLHTSGYAYRSVYDNQGIHRPVRMHQQIKRYPSRRGKVVDHINGVRLDNRRDNLRTVDPETNSQNRLPQSGGTSAYRGVSYLGPNRWSARMRNRYLGTYGTELEAAVVADKARVKTMPGAMPCRFLAEAMAQELNHEFDIPA